MRGKPVTVVSDNGTELASMAILNETLFTSLSHAPRAARYSKAAIDGSIS